jgi:hypothetical protein
MKYIFPDFFNIIPISTTIQFNQKHILWENLLTLVKDVIVFFSSQCVLKEMTA